MQTKRGHCSEVDCRRQYTTLAEDLCHQLTAKCMTTAHFHAKQTRCHVKCTALYFICMHAIRNTAYELTLQPGAGDANSGVASVVETQFLHDDLTAHVHSADSAVRKLKLDITKWCVKASNDFIDPSLLIRHWVEKPGR